MTSREGSQQLILRQKGTGREWEDGGREPGRHSKNEISVRQNQRKTEGSRGWDGWREIGRVLVAGCHGVAVPEGTREKRRKNSEGKEKINHQHKVMKRGPNAGTGRPGACLICKGGREHREGNLKDAEATRIIWMLLVLVLVLAPDERAMVISGASLPGPGPLSSFLFPN